MVFSICICPSEQCRCGIGCIDIDVVTDGHRFSCVCVRANKFTIKIQHVQRILVRAQFSLCMLHTGAHTMQPSLINKLCYNLFAKFMARWVMRVCVGGARACVCVIRIYLNANKQFGWVNRCVFCVNEGMSKCPAASVCAQLLDYANANMYLNIYEWVRPKIIFNILWWFTFSSLFFVVRAERVLNHMQRDHAERSPMHTIVVFVRQNTGANKRNSSNAIFSEISIQTQFYSNLKSTRNTIKASIWVSRRHSHSTLTRRNKQKTWWYCAIVMNGLITLLTCVCARTFVCVK